MASPRKTRRATVRGIHAPAPRMTKAAAFLLATVLSLPVFLVLSGLQWWMG